MGFHEGHATIPENLKCNKPLYLFNSIFQIQNKQPTTWNPFCGIKVQILLSSFRIECVLFTLFIHFGIIQIMLKKIIELGYLMLFRLLTQTQMRLLFCIRASICIGTLKTQRNLNGDGGPIMEANFFFTNFDITQYEIVNGWNFRVCIIRNVCAINAKRPRWQKYINFESFSLCFLLSEICYGGLSMCI